MSNLPDSPLGIKRIFIDNEIPRFKQVVRSWFKRIFTRPWRPFKAYDLVEIYLVKKFGDNIFIMNAHTYEYMKQQYRALIYKKRWDSGEDIPTPSKHNH